MTQPPPLMPPPPGDGNTPPYGQGAPLPPPQGQGAGMPPPPGYYPPPPSGKTNGFAIAALIFGIIGGVLFAVIFGFVALSQIRKRGDKGRGMAIAGLVLSAAWVILLVAVFIIGDGLRATRDTNTGQVTQAGQLDVFDLKDGDCFNNVPGDNKEVMSVSAVPCTQPHDAEVLSQVTVAGSGAYPGTDQIAAEVEKLCVDKVGARVEASPIADKLGIYYFYPTKESWAQGDRAGTCVAVANDNGKLTAPVGK
ncbi:DUF4190 domain-containing protein [Kibdelosporangium aridum]|uniref:DUF4190 domain-containing protein n=1 Tax=Kibdelosporangium aridum TaxID=2030 RepID=A0A428ZFP2_KIBAR|nr:DUF4190 domain-containing protein [Kibdelosporangium aridum]RSM86886.1 DUF4190 domain-containing protein [Kibdelosporangium aridum]